MQNYCIEKLKQSYIYTYIIFYSYTEFFYFVFWITKRFNKVKVEIRKKTLINAFFIIMKFF